MPVWKEAQGSDPIPKPKPGIVDAADADGHAGRDLQQGQSQTMDLGWLKIGLKYV